MGRKPGRPRIRIRTEEEIAAIRENKAAPVLSTTPPSATFRVIRTNMILELEAEANTLLNDGWQPVGGVSITVIPATVMSEPRFVYCLGMVKS